MIACFGLLLLFGFIENYLSSILNKFLSLGPLLHYEWCGMRMPLYMNRPGKRIALNVIDERTADTLGMGWQKEFDKRGAVLFGRHVHRLAK